MKIPSYDNYIFDFDGTIVDLIVNWRQLKSEVNVMCDNSNINCSLRFNEKIDSLKINHRSSVLRLLESYENPSHTGPIIRPIEKTILFLKKLPKYSIISNNLTSTIHDSLRSLSLNHNCIKVIGINSVIKSKPNIEAYSRLYDSLQFGKTLYVGDQGSDRIFSVNCGIDYLHPKDL